MYCKVCRQPYTFCTCYDDASGDTCKRDEKLGDDIGMTERHHHYLCNPLLPKSA